MSAPQNQSDAVATDYLDEQKVWETEPLVLRARSGWLAQTPDGHPYRLAVIEPTEGAARSAFRETLAAWSELHLRCEQAQ